MSTELESIPFDHYQRYAAAAALVNALAMPTAAVLEVGANRQRLLSSFLPSNSLLFSDLFEQSGADDFVQADASALPFADAQFEAVVALDVIEHMPVHLRAKAATEMARVAARLVVISCPLDKPWVHEAEHVANNVWQNYFGKNYPWLEEHQQFGLVTGDEIEKALLESGRLVLRFGQGDSVIWSGLMGAHFVKEVIEELRPIVAEADRLYNHGVFAGDRSEKSYREYFVAVRDEEDLKRIQGASVLTARPNKAAEKFLSSLGTLLRPVADRILDGEAKLTVATTEWGRTAELLREVEAEKFRATEQWQAASDRLRESEIKQLHAWEQLQAMADRLRESETRQLHASEQWQATADRLRESEARQLHASEQWQATADRLRESEAKQLYVSEQWRQTAERFREIETKYQSLMVLHSELLLRLGRLKKWALHGGALALLTALVAAFLRLI